MKQDVIWEWLHLREKLSGINILAELIEVGQDI